MKSLKEKENELLEDFEMLPDWEDKYKYIMDMGADLHKIDEKDKTPATKVEGCQSASWLIAEKRDGRLYYKGDSEAVLGKGVISMLLHIINGSTPAEIASYDFRLIHEIELPAHLSPIRRMGLESVMKRILELAEQNL